MGTSFSPLISRISRIRNGQLFACDLLALALTPFFGLFLRMDGLHELPRYAGSLLFYTAAAVALRVALLHLFGLYRRCWRYGGVDDLAALVLASLCATLLLTGLFFTYGQFQFHGQSLPRSLPLLEGLLSLAVTVGLRFSVRMAEQLLRPAPNQDARPVLIVGAGATGQMIVKELQANPAVGLQPVGFLDDDPQKQHGRILNLPVLGSRSSLALVVRKLDVKQVIIAMPRAPGRVIREVVQACEAAGVPARTLPAFSEILDGAVSVDRLRAVEIQDLLRRDPVETDILAVREFLRGKRVLVTGGGGSIGSELCRQVLRCGPAELSLLGHGENSVFDIVNELQSTLDAVPPRGSDAGTDPPLLHAVIADVRFADRVRHVIGQFRPDIIFHAAAHKHVPLMEANLTEAISNNVFGTRNLLNAALEFGVGRFVMISSDKAVNPTSIMGASKRIAELLVLRAGRRSGKDYVAVRFGNVLGSRGSVVLTFQRQIARGGPVTVSDPVMTRYFMTIPEAVQLVLQSAVLGRSAEVFVLDMGEPVRILDLARDLIELSGLEVGSDVEIAFTGSRPGEKLHEELFIQGERYERTHEKIFVTLGAAGLVPRDLDGALERLESAVRSDDWPALLRTVGRLLPEFQHAGAGAESDRAYTPERIDAVPIFGWHELDEEEAEPVG